MENWHELSFKDVLKNLHSNQEGLTEQEARKRLQKFGFNEFEEKKKISKLAIFLRQFKSFLIIILIIAAIISLVLIGSLLDSVVILAIVVVNAVLGFVQEFKAEKAMEALKKLAAPKTYVLRDGKKKEILSKYLIPGDIVFLEEGSRVPADIRLFEISNMKIDESALTGESVPATKELGVTSAKVISERKNMAYMGTVVNYGRGRGIVVNTGMLTEMGKIAKMIQVPEEPTPLQKKLKTFGKNLGFLILAICAIIIVVGILKGGNILDMIITGIALAVAAIPEGLPAVVTITLTFGLQKMAKHNAIVRNLSSVESLGSTTVICSDKTGTLTRNEMVVRKVFYNSRIVNVTGDGYEPRGEFIGKSKIDSNKDKTLSLLLRTGALCNNAELEKDKTWKIIGDPTEGALLVTAAKAFDLDKLRGSYPREGENPFSSERKMMSTLNKDSDGKACLYAKGAAETILDLCTGIYKNGRITKLTKSEKENILDINKKLAGEALRVLAFAYKSGNSGEKDLIFVGLMGMIDSPRPGVREDIQLCRKAGIKSIMITGDHRETAVAIARELNMLSGSERVLTGSELDEIKDEELDRIIEDVAVYARVNPSHKVRIVNSLKRRGHIVAMTGDGVNDAPALKNADIGISMGIKGTDVAKEASDMILKDDNFSTIVSAVKEGRRIYDNIKKFIQYLLSSNLGEVLVIFLAMLIGFTDPATGLFILPVTAIQLLWINLVTDGLPAVALGVDPPSKDIMLRKPRNPKENILSRQTLTDITVVGIIITIGTLFLFNLELGSGALKARTMAFTLLVMFEMVRIQSVRMKYNIGFFSNKKLIIAIIISILLQVFVIYLPALQIAFGTVALGLFDWIKIILISLTVIIIMAIKSRFFDKERL